MYLDFHPFKSPAVIKAHKKFDNIIVKRISNSKKAVIYCSSNGIYNNSYKDFEKKIIIQNKFEWLKNDWIIHDSGLNIYIRDIYKQWYVKGINSKLNSINDMIEFIRNITKGFEVITIGSSAGGYIATLIGCKLNAKYVLSFSGQFNLYNQGKNNELLWENINNNEIGSYNELKSIIENSNTKIVYFYGSKSNVDFYDIDYAKKISKNLYRINMNNKIHGIPFERDVLKIMFSNIEKVLLTLTSKDNDRKYNRYLFELRNIGIIEFTKIYIKKIFFKKRG